MIQSQYCATYINTIQLIKKLNVAQLNLLSMHDSHIKNYIAFSKIIDKKTTHPRKNEICRQAIFQSNGNCQILIFTQIQTKNTCIM